MTYLVEVIDGGAAREFADAWDDLARRDASLPGGLDATACFAWFDALRAAFDAASQARVVVLRDAVGAVGGLLALVADPDHRGGLIEPTAIHGGRNGFLLADPSVECLDALLRGAERAFGAWRSIRIVLVAGGTSDKLLASLCARHGYRTVASDIEQSPYFPIADADAFAKSMSKRLKRTLRSATSGLQSTGQFEIHEFGAPADVDAAIESILAVERASWKHGAGMAITCHPEQERFYRALLPRAARAGMLYGVIARLGGRPIAHHFGLVHGGVFSCLKHSQTVEEQAHSPGFLVVADMIAGLRKRGVSTFDYMGKVEPHKMLWSDANGTYVRRLVCVYPPTLQGRLAFGQHAIRRALRHWFDRGATAQEPDKTETA